MSNNRHFRFAIAMGSKYPNVFQEKCQQLWVIVTDKNNQGINARIYKNVTKSTLERIIIITEGYRKDTKDSLPS